MHADHLTSARYLKERLGGKTGIGWEVPKVQQIFKTMFNLGSEFIPDGGHFDHLFADNEIFTVGKLSAKAVSTSGHTPADLSYQFGDAIFVGDTLFMPDTGDRACRFSGRQCAAAIRSTKLLLGYPPENAAVHVPRLPAASRKPQWESTVADQRARNIHVHEGVTENDYVAMRVARDKTLGIPTLLSAARFKSTCGPERCLHQKTMAFRT